MDTNKLREMKNFFAVWHQFFHSQNKAYALATVAVNYHYVATIDMGRTYPTAGRGKDYFRHVNGKISEVTRDELVALLPVINCPADESSLDSNISRCLMKQGPAFGWLFNPVLRVLKMAQQRGGDVSWSSKIFLGTVSTYGAEIALLKAQKGKYADERYTQQWKNALKMSVISCVKRAGIDIASNVSDASLQWVPVVRCARGLHVLEPYDFVVRHGTAQLVWGHMGFESHEDFRCNKIYLANQLVQRCGEAELVSATQRGVLRQKKRRKLTSSTFPPYHLRHPQI